MPTFYWESTETCQSGRKLSSALWVRPFYGWSDHDTNNISLDLTNTAMSPVSEPSLNASSALPTQLSSSSVSSLVEEPPLQHSPTRAVSPPPSRSHGAAIPSITSARNVHPTSPPVGRASDRYISEKPSRSTSPPHVQTGTPRKQRNQWIKLDWRSI